ncbi:hypothetical protein SPWS13_0202 [Shewanella putrefaciens]|nr:hypothetical protein SPWS13_0202 [Shewanella putrefaciens]
MRQHRLSRFDTNVINKLDVLSRKKWLSYTFLTLENAARMLICTLAQYWA